MNFAGLPAHSSLLLISDPGVTTAPAAIIHPSPISTPPKITLFAPIQTLSASLILLKVYPDSFN